jgi:hypothetical protein
VRTLTGVLLSGFAYLIGRKPKLIFMSLDDLVNKLDSKHSVEILIMLLMTNISENRGLNMLYLQIMSEGDDEFFQKNIAKLKDLHHAEYKKLKEKLYEKYGYLALDDLDI